MNVSAQSRPSTLFGCRILVVEDEYMIAEEIADALSDAGADTLGPVSRVQEALALIAAAERIDGALLDVNVFDEAIWPVVDELSARGVPMVLVTGYDASAIPAAYAHVAHQEKPTTGQDLAHALARVLADAAPPRSLP